MWKEGVTRLSAVCARHQGSFSMKRTRATAEKWTTTLCRTWDPIAMNRFVAIYFNLCIVFIVINHEVCE